MSISRTTIAPQGESQFLTGRVILAHAERFVLRSPSGQSQLFELSQTSALTARDLVDLARSGPLVTIEYRTAALTPGMPTAMRMFLGAP
ncbi:MAG TPA: hypothetical protein VGD75_02645 [Bradyrhizobium sp.]